MQVTRFDMAKPYDAKNHFDMTAMRLQGIDATDCEDFWVGHSTFLPGGGTEWGSSPTSKVYVIVDGYMSVKTDNEEVELGPMDSIYLEPNEERSIQNKRDQVATMLVISI